MKKFLSVILSLCILLSLSTILFSCEHECEFSDEWSKDDSHHWHTCTKEKCEEVADKEEHSWDEWEIVSSATQDADGVKKYTCSVCEQTKTEAIEFTGLTQWEWNDAISVDAFKNFTYNETAVTTGGGVSVNSSTDYKFTKNAAYIKMTVANETEAEYFYDTDTVEQLRSQIVSSIKSMTKYQNFEYVPESKTYKYVPTTGVYLPSMNAYTSNITLRFDGDRLVEIKYTVVFTQSNIAFDVESTVTLSDYGNTEL